MALKSHGVAVRPKITTHTFRAQASASPEVLGKGGSVCGGGVVSSPKHTFLPGIRLGVYMRVCVCMSACVCFKNRDAKKREKEKKKKKKNKPRLPRIARHSNRARV